jgi:ParB family chromosome partitioning protein
LREDLKPIEQARAFQSLIEGRGLTQRQLAERLQVGQGTISRALALLTLPEEVRRSVDAGRIGPDAAYQLTKVDDPDDLARLACEAAAGGLKRDEVKARVSKPRKGRGVRKPTSRVFRKAAGLTVTFESPRGVDPESIRAALAEVLARLDAEATGQAAA